LGLVGIFGKRKKKAPTKNKNNGSLHAQTQSETIASEKISNELIIEKNRERKYFKTHNPVKKIVKPKNIALISLAAKKSSMPKTLKQAIKIE
jgi:hypothetical protein